MLWRSEFDRETNDDKFLIFSYRLWLLIFRIAKTTHSCAESIVKSVESGVVCEPQAFHPVRFKPQLNSVSKVGLLWA